MERKRMVAWLLGPLLLAGSLVGLHLALAAQSNDIPPQTTPAYLDGRVVTVQYEQIYFCGTSGAAATAAVSDCKISGSFPDVDPVAGQAISELDVIVPFFGDGRAGHPELGGAEAAYFPGAYGLTTQCPVGGCTNHPSFVDLQGFGGFHVVPLPAHSHIIGVNRGGWWELKVFLVLDGSLWPSTDGSRGISSRAALNQAVMDGKVLGPVDTNIYLFFDVVGR